MILKMRHCTLQSTMIEVNSFSQRSTRNGVHQDHIAVIVMQESNVSGGAESL